MCVIRRSLEQSSWHLLCYGASKNVYPSGMSRGMGSRGHMAYKLQFGQQARMADLVNIFDTGPDVQPASVAEQQEYFEEWLRSLK